AYVEEIQIVKLLILVLFIPFASFAQGTVLFTWHGNSNFFQASFEVTQAEMDSGQPFNSSLFTNTVQISSLDGLMYRASDQQPAPFIYGRFSPPLSLTFILADQNTLSRIEANVVPGQGASIVETSPLPNGRNGESG